MLHRSSAFTFLLLALAACGDDTQPADAGDRPRRDAGGGKLDCTGVFDCVDSCRDGDDDCTDACIDRASSSAAPDVSDLLSCAERNGCDGEDCLAQQCEAELLACAGLQAFDGGVPDGGSSALDCPGVFDCVENCRDGDDTCIEGCVERGSSAATPLVNGLLTCAERNGCDDEACLAERCSAEVLACAGAPALDGGTPDGGAGCDGTGKPELTGPITGLAASYAAGDEIHIGVPVDQDTARVIVGVYEVGSLLYLGGTAEDVAPSSSATLDLYAGVKNGATGTFYIAVELCSSKVCTPPFIRNTYQRADRTAPRAFGEAYVQTRENVGGGPGTPQTCGTSIPIQSFLIQ